MKKVKKEDQNKVVGGIYSIINKINGRQYIGSTHNFKERKNNHFKSLRGNYKTTNKYLQQEFNEFGENNFIFKIVEINPDNLLDRENYWINFYNTKWPNGYNIYDSYGAGKASEETRLKQSLNCPDRHGKNNPFYGKKHSIESKKRISNSMNGSKHPQSKITLDDNYKIKLLLKENNNNISKVARLLNLSTTPVKQIRDGTHWTSIIKGINK